MRPFKKSQTFWHWTWPKWKGFKATGIRQLHFTSVYRKSLVLAAHILQESGNYLKTLNCALKNYNNNLCNASALILWCRFLVLRLWFHERLFSIFGCHAIQHCVRRDSWPRIQRLCVYCVCRCEINSTISPQVSKYTDCDVKIACQGSFPS